MNQRTDEKVKEELQQQRLLERKRLQQQEHKRARLLAELQEVALDFHFAPEQVTAWLADQRASGRLVAADEARLFERVTDLMGGDFAQRAFGRESVAEEAGTASETKVAEQWGAAAQRAGDDRVRNQHIRDANRGRADQTAALLDRLAGFLGLDASSVAVHLDDAGRQKTSARSARGVMDDGAIYLNPETFDPQTAEGRYVLGHEMVHVAQREEVAAAANGQQAPSKPLAEAEAAAMGQAFAQGGAIGRPEQILPAMDQAADRDAANADGGGPSVSIPDKVTFNLAGRRIDANLPSAARPGRVRVTGLDFNLGGLSLTTAQLRFSDSWEFLGGELKGSISIGDNIQMDDVSLNVDKSKRVSATITGAAVTLGSYLSGTMDLRITGRGISGQATFTHTEVEIGHYRKF